MRLLEKYIFLRLLTNFFWVFTLLLFLYLVGDVLGKLSDILRNDVSINIVVGYYIHLLPHVLLKWAIPLSALISSLYTLTIFSKNNELIAIRTSGASNWVILKIILCFCLVLSLCNFLIQEKWLSSAYLKATRIKRVKIKAVDSNKAEPIEHITYYGKDNRIFYIKKFLPNDNKLLNILVMQLDSNNELLNLTRIEQAIWDGNKWNAFNFLSNDLHNFHKSNFLDFKAETDWNIPEKPENFFQGLKKPQDMGLAEIRTFIARLRSVGAEEAITRFSIEYYNKILFPFLPIFLTLGGLPFVLVIKQRGATLLPVAIGLALGIFFFMFLFTCISIGQKEFIPAEICIIIPYLTYFLLGILGVGYVR